MNCPDCGTRMKRKMHNYYCKECQKRWYVSYFCVYQLQAKPEFTEICANWDYEDFKDYLSRLPKEKET